MPIKIVRADEGDRMAYLQVKNRVTAILGRPDSVATMAIVMDGPTKKYYGEFY